MGRGEGTGKRLLLVRHCQATGQEPDAPLADVGLRQARDLAEFLREEPIDFIAASAFTRARQSAEPLAERLGLAVSIDSRLNERVLSPSPILNWRDILRDSFDDHDLRAPGGESAGEALERGWACLGEMLGGGHRLPLAVTHGNLMSLALHSIDPAFGYGGWESLDNPDVYVLEEDGNGRLSFGRVWRP